MRSVQQYSKNIQKSIHDAPFRRNLVGSPGGFDYLQAVRLRNQQKKSEKAQNEATLYKNQFEGKQAENERLNRTYDLKEKDYLDRINQKESEINKLAEDFGLSRQKAEQDAIMLREKKKQKGRELGLTREEMRGMRYNLDNSISENKQKDAAYRELVNQNQDLLSVISSKDSHLNKIKDKKKSYKEENIANRERYEKYRQDYEEKLKEQQRLIETVGKEKSDEILREREEKKKILEKYNLTNADFKKLGDQYKSLSSNHEETKKHLEAQEVVGKQQNETIKEYNERINDYQKRLKADEDKLNDIQSKYNFNQNESKILSKHYEGVQKKLADNMSDVSRLNRDNERYKKQIDPYRGKYFEEEILPKIRDYTDNPIFKSYKDLSSAPRNLTGYNSDVDPRDYFKDWYKKHKGSYDPKLNYRNYYEQQLLPILQKLSLGDAKYKNFESFTKDPKTGYDPKYTPDEYLQNQWLKYPKHKKAFEELNIPLPKYKEFNPYDVGKFVEESVNSSSNWDAKSSVNDAGQSMFGGSSKYRVSNPASSIASFVHDSVHGSNPIEEADRIQKSINEESSWRDVLKKDYKQREIEDKLLPILQKLSLGDAKYKNFESFTKDPKTGYDPKYTPDEYLQNQWLKYPKHKKAFEELNIPLPKYKEFPTEAQAYVKDRRDRSLQNKNAYNKNQQIYASQLEKYKNENQLLNNRLNQGNERVNAYNKWADNFSPARKYMNKRLKDGPLQMGKLIEQNKKNPAFFLLDLDTGNKFMGYEKAKQHAEQEKAKLDPFINITSIKTPRLSKF